jgi:site-specific recombinase XerD
MITALIHKRLSHNHLIVNSTGIPFDNRSRLYHAFMRCCKLAEIQTQTLDGQGRVKEHVEVHSLRRTFATNLIMNGADLKTVQELLGHSTLEITLKLYSKIHGGNKRQVLDRLSYGQGVLVPEHILEYPEMSGKPVQNGHTITTSPDTLTVKQA